MVRRNRDLDIMPTSLVLCRICYYPESLSVLYADCANKDLRLMPSFAFR